MNKIFFYITQIGEANGALYLTLVTDEKISRYKFIQNKWLTEHLVAVHPYGAIIIKYPVVEEPSDIAAFKVEAMKNLELEYDGKRYKPKQDEVMYPMLGNAYTFYIDSPAPGESPVNNIDIQYQESTEVIDYIPEFSKDVFEYSTYNIFADSSISLSFILSDDDHAVVGTYDDEALIFGQMSEYFTATFNSGSEGTHELTVTVDGAHLYHITVNVISPSEPLEISAMLIEADGTGIRYSPSLSSDNNSYSCEIPAGTSTVSVEFEAFNLASSTYTFNDVQIQTGSTTVSFSAEAGTLVASFTGDGGDTREISIEFTQAAGQ